MMEEIISKFRERFQGNPIVVRAPGRINILGEHTDYNGGLVLPVPIEKSLWFALGREGSSQFSQVYANDLQENISIDLNQHEIIKDGSWESYIRSILLELSSAGFKTPGLQVIFGGNIPSGAGLSSSAALCCGMIAGISALYDLNIPKKQIALMAQSSEHRIGLNCGIMDQFAILFGKAGKALILDCHSLESSYIPMALGDYSFILVNSMIKHSLAADSGYNERRASCERVYALLKKENPGINNLSQANEKMFDSIAHAVSAEDLKRARYILKENQRVLAAVNALQSGDLPRLGALMVETHKGLRDEYEVSIMETDYLVSRAREFRGILGARMVGGGFGGCTLNLIEKGLIGEFTDWIKEVYTDKTGLHPEVIPVETAEGLTVITDNQGNK